MPPKKARVFNTGDLVFAKIKGYPPWPARIEEDHPEGFKPTPGRYPVFFFGTYQTAVVIAKDIFPYEQYKSQYGIERKKMKHFNLGLQEIEKTPNMSLSDVNENASGHDELPQSEGGDDDDQSSKSDSSFQKSDFDISSDQSSTSSSSVSDTEDSTSKQGKRNTGKSTTNLSNKKTKKVSSDDESEDDPVNHKIIKSMVKKSTGSKIKTVMVSKFSQESFLSVASLESSSSSSPSPSLKSSESEGSQVFHMPTSSDSDSDDDIQIKSVKRSRLSDSEKEEESSKPSSSKPNEKAIVKTRQVNEDDSDSDSEEAKNKTKKRVRIDSDESDSNDGNLQIKKLKQKLEEKEREKERRKREKMERKIQERIAKEQAQPKPDQQKPAQQKTDQQVKDELPFTTKKFLEDTNRVIQNALAIINPNVQKCIRALESLAKDCSKMPDYEMEIYLPTLKNLIITLKKCKNYKNDETVRDMSDTCLEIIRAFLISTTPDYVPRVSPKTGSSNVPKVENKEKAADNNTDPEDSKSQQMSKATIDLLSTKEKQISPNQKTEPPIEKPSYNDMPTFKKRPTQFYRTGSGVRGVPKQSSQQNPVKSESDSKEEVESTDD